MKINQIYMSFLLVLVFSINAINAFNSSSRAEKRAELQDEKKVTKRALAKAKAQARQKAGFLCREKQLAEIRQRVAQEKKLAEALARKKASKSGIASFLFAGNRNAQIMRAADSSAGVPKGRSTTTVRPSDVCLKVFNYADGL